MRGIVFKCNSGIDNKNLLEIFKNIEVSSFKMCVGFQEIFRNIDSNKINIKSDIMFKEFLKICSNNDFYVIFLEMFIYKKGEDIVDTPNNYEEYTHSNWEGSLFITDSAFVEIYSKNDYITKKIVNNVSNENYCNQEYITDENDGRTRFSVW